MKKLFLVLVLAAASLSAGDNTEKKMQCRQACLDKHASCQRDCMQNKPDDRSCTQKCSDKYYTACQNQCK